MIDFKVNFEKKYGMDLRCPFCNVWDETLEHIFVCDSGLSFSKILQNFNMACISGDFSHKMTKSLGKFLDKYFIYRDRRTAKLKEGYIFYIFLQLFSIAKSDFKL